MKLKDIVISMLLLLVFTSCTDKKPVVDVQNVENLINLNKDKKLFLNFWYSMSQKQFEDVVNYEISKGSLVRSGDSLFFFFTFNHMECAGCKVKAWVTDSWFRNDSLGGMTLLFLPNMKTTISSARTFDKEEVNIIYAMRNVLKLYYDKYGQPKKNEIGLPMFGVNWINENIRISTNVDINAENTYTFNGKTYYNNESSYISFCFIRYEYLKWVEEDEKERKRQQPIDDSLRIIDMKKREQKRKDEI